SPLFTFRRLRFPTEEEITCQGRKNECSIDLLCRLRSVGYRSVPFRDEFARPSGPPATSLHEDRRKPARRLNRWNAFKPPLILTVYFKEPVNFLPTALPTKPVAAWIRLPTSSGRKGPTSGT